MAYRIIELRDGEAGGFSPRGGARDLWRYKGPECMLSGPAETGKTWASCHKLNALAWKYPKSQNAMIRKTQASMASSVILTFKRIIGDDSPIKIYGGEKPEWFDYPNGSRIWVGGMDNPNKVLSSERDFIYVNQAEELAIEDWEYLRTRNTGRGGVAPYAQQFADCNPGPPNHWIKERQKSGSLELFESRHEDNPSLFDNAGVITDQGVKSLAVLDGLTGVRYYRLRKGLWVAADGVVYETYDPAVHYKNRSDVKLDPSWPHVWDVDFGYENPFVWHDWILDPDGIMILNKEIYVTKRLVEDLAKQITEVTKNDPSPRWIVVDHDAEDRATFERHTGMRTRAAHKGVSDGIQACQTRLKVSENGRPRMIILRDALIEVDRDLKDAKRPVCTADEFEVYIWDVGAGKNIKDKPLKVNDHGMDAWRYQVAELDGLKVPEKPAYMPSYGAGSGKWIKK